LSFAFRFAELGIPDSPFDIIEPISSPNSTILLNNDCATLARDHLFGILPDLKKFVMYNQKYNKNV